MAEKALTVGKVLEQRRKSTKDTLQGTASLRHGSIAPYRERGSSATADNEQEFWKETVGKIKESLLPEFNKLNERLDDHDERFDSIDESLGVIRKHLGV
jgi:hypothetical protein